MPPLEQAAHQLAHVLTDAHQRIVLAESCTGGLASATLAQVPGVSQWHCGSAVTYRERTKVDWLGVPLRDLEQVGAVSDTVARRMAHGVLQRTIEADCAAAVTGHLGPNAPEGLDGVVYVSVAMRQADGSIADRVERYELDSRRRVDRQAEAAALLLNKLAQQVRRTRSAS